MNATAISSAERVIHDYYRLADEGSTELALSLFAEDAEIRFGNNLAGNGVQTLLSAAETLATVCTTMRHTVTGVFVDAVGLNGSAELAMTYVRHDGTEFRAPAAGVFALNELAQITKYHVYVDLTGLVSS